MLPYSFKQFVFVLGKPLSHVNLLRKQALLRKWSGNSGGRLLLNVGCGRKPIHGFCNIDANPLARPNLYMDIRIGIPFPAQSVDAIYANHVFEHLYLSELKRVLNHCYRVLKKGGGIRVGVPSMGEAIKAYCQGNSDWFPDWPDAFTSIGGRFVNYLLCRDQHKLMFDFGFMVELLAGAGFTDCTEVDADTSSLFTKDDIVRMTEAGIIPHTLFVEAFKM